MLYESGSGERHAFYERPLATVREHIPKQKTVKIEAGESALLICFKLVKAGYGNLEDVKKMNAREALQALHYEGFLADYGRALHADS